MVLKYVNIDRYRVSALFIDFGLCSFFLFSGVVFVSLYVVACVVFVIKCTDTVPENPDVSRHVLQVVWCHVLFKVVPLCT